MTNDQDKIEALKKRLYSISDEPPHSLRPKLHKHATQAKDTWADEGEELDTPVTKPGDISGGMTMGGSSMSGASPFATGSSMSGVDTLVHGSTSSNPASGHISTSANIMMNKKTNDTFAKDLKSDSGRRGRILKRILAVSLFACLAAVFFFYYVYVTGSNNVSNANIDVNIVGPVSSPAGEILTLDIDVTNRNPSSIEAVDLIIRYPEGTKVADDRSTTILSDRLPVGNIAQGQTVRRRIQFILFGEENVKKNIKLIAQYKIPGSIILFNKEKEYPIYIGSAPIAIDVTTFKEVVPNQSTTFKAVITSNSPNIIKNLVMQASYPSGFKFEKASPAPSFGTNIWTIGDMSPGDRREIDIDGQVIGDAEVERYFTFTAGTEDPLDHSRIASKLVETKKQVQVKKPFLAADVSLNKVGDAIYVAQAGEPIRGEIIWQNNLTVPLYDVVIEAKLNGATLDKSSVDGDRGFYNSSQNTIVWDNSTVDEMRELQPGLSGALQFSFASLPPSSRNNSTLRRQEISLDIVVRAKRLSENQVPEELRSTASRDIKIASGLTLTSNLVRNVGPFENTGPIPPRAEVPSTYTVMNSVSNSFNNVKNVTYTATLPSYVKWMGKVYPETAVANVKYNADRREITWSLGDIAPGTGHNSSAREFAFQVELLPSVSQVGQAPVIVNAQRVAGTDSFTETIVQGNAQALDTKISSDPNFQFGWEKVLE